jgi:hypothetical protein
LNLREELTDGRIYAFQRMILAQKQPMAAKKNSSVEKEKTDTTPTRELSCGDVPPVTACH